MEKKGNYGKAIVFGKRKSRFFSAFYCKGSSDRVVISAHHHHHHAHLKKSSKKWKLRRRRGFLDLEAERKRGERNPPDKPEVKGGGGRGEASTDKMRVDVDVRSIRVIPKSVLKIGVKLPEVVGGGGGGKKEEKKTESGSGGGKLVRRYSTVHYRSSK